jgi:hypothetical protein
VSRCSCSMECQDHANVSAPVIQLSTQPLSGLRKGVKGKAGVGALLKDPSTIEDPCLRREVQAAVAGDVVYGPAVDISRRMAGLEYEMMLQQELKARRIPFISEVRRPGSRLLLATGLAGRYACCEAAMLAASCSSRCFHRLLPRCPE